MSKQLHKSFRRVLTTTNWTTEYNGQLVKCKSVLWAIVDFNTARSVKTKHIGLSVYVQSGKNYGITAWSPRKAVSIQYKSPISSKFFDNINLDRAVSEAFGDAMRRYILSKDALCKNLTGVVTYFNNTEGFIKVGNNLFPVYACNIKGAKTAYPETACMYLIAGETVTLDLRDMGDHLTCRVTSGAHFDADKWNSLDQKSLAFKCNEDGEVLNGLFE